MLKQSESKKWRERKSAIALSAGTCLLLSILGFEIYRTNTERPLLLEKKEIRSVSLVEPTTVRHARDIAELENKIYDLKRLLFVKDAARDNTRIQAVREKLREKDIAIQELENKNKDSQEYLEAEKRKLVELEKTVSTLLETIDLHKGSKEKSQDKFTRLLDSSKYDHQNDLRDLNQKIAQLQGDKEKLEFEIQQLNIESAEQEKQTLSQIADLKERISQLEQQDSLASLKESSLRDLNQNLALELNELNGRLKEHEQSGQDQASYISEVHLTHDKELASIKSQLEASQLELEAMIAKGNLADEKNRDLEDSLRNLLVKHTEMKQELYDKINRRENDLNQYELEIVSLGEEKQKLLEEIALERALQSIQLSSLTQENHEFKSQVEQLTARHNELSSNGEELNQTKEILKAELHLAIENLDHAKSTILNLEHEQESKAEEIALLNQKLEALSASHNTLDKAHTELSEHKNKLEWELKSTTENLNQLTQNLEAASSSNQNLDVAHAELLQHKNNLEQEIKTAHENMGQQKYVLEKYMQEIEDKEALIAKLTEQLRETSAAHTSTLYAKEDIEKQLLTLHDELEQEKTLTLSLQNEVKKSSSEILGLITKLDEEISSKEELYKSNDDLNNRLKDSSQLTQDSSSTLDSLQEMLKLLERERDELKDQLERLVQQTDRLKSEKSNESSELTAKVQELEYQAQTLSQLLEQEKTMTLTLQNEVKKSSSEILGLNSKLEDEISTKEELYKSNDDLTNRLNYSRQLTQDSSLTLDNLEEKLNLLANERDEYKNRLSLLSEHANKLESEKKDESAELTTKIQALEFQTQSLSELLEREKNRADEAELLKQELFSKLSESVDLQERLVQTHANKEDLANELKQLKNQIVMEQLQKDEIIEHYKEFMNIHDDILNKISHLENQKETLRNRVITLQDEILQERMKTHELADKLSDLQLEKAAKDNQIEVLQSDYEKAKSDNENQADGLMKQIESLKQEAEKLSKQIEQEQANPTQE